MTLMPQLSIPLRRLLFRVSSNPLTMPTVEFFPRMPLFKLRCHLPFMSRIQCCHVLFPWPGPAIIAITTIGDHTRFKNDLLFIDPSKYVLVIIIKRCDTSGVIQIGRAHV